MKVFFQTVTIAAVLIIIALILISISLLFTGKSVIKSGTCGRIPKRGKKGDECEKLGGCDLCDSEPKKESSIIKDIDKDED